MFIRLEWFVVFLDSKTSSVEEIEHDMCQEEDLSKPDVEKEFPFEEALDHFLELEKQAA